MEVKGVDECMLKEYLEKTYGRNEPIFINEIRLEGVNDNSLRQSFTRMVKAGELLTLIRVSITFPIHHAC